MARVSHLIVDGLAFVLAGIGLAAAVMGQAPKLPASTMPSQLAVGASVEPVQTGSIAPKGKGTAASKTADRIEARVGAATPSSKGAGRIWVDPPHRWTSSGREGSAIDQATGWRIP